MNLEYDDEGKAWIDGYYVDDEKVPAFINRRIKQLFYGKKQKVSKVKLLTEPEND